MRARAWTAVIGLGVLLGLAGACGDSEALPDDDSLALPDREDLPPDSAVAKRDAEPADTSVPDTAAPVDAADAAPVGLRVFVTSTTSNARFNGLAGADTICKNLASAAGLTGTWTAWLSNENGPSALARVTSTGPWRLRGGEIVAASKIALVSGTLAHAIDRDEKGALVPASRVWTGTGTNGQYQTNDCDKWTNGNNGRVGTSAGADATWTSVAVDDCDSARRLYCFEL